MLCASRKAQADEKGLDSSVEKPIKRHFWLTDNPVSLCGAASRTYKGNHPDRHKYPRCQDCRWKAEQMGFDVNTD